MKYEVLKRSHLKRNIVIGLLVVALNFSKVGNLLSTGMSKLASKATELSFTFDKVKQEAFGTINGSEDLKQARETYRQEQYIFLQQEMYGKSLSKYTKTMEASAAQEALNLQNRILSNDALLKQVQSDILLNNYDEKYIDSIIEAIRVQRRQNGVSEDLIESETKLIREQINQINELK